MFKNYVLFFAAAICIVCGFGFHVVNAGKVSLGFSNVKKQGPKQRLLERFLKAQKDLIIKDDQNQKVEIKKEANSSKLIIKKLKTGDLSKKNGKPMATFVFNKKTDPVETKKYNRVNNNLTKTLVCIQRPNNSKKSDVKGVLTDYGFKFIDSNKCSNSQNNNN